MTDAVWDQAKTEELAVDRGLDPLMEHTFRRLVGEVPKRALTMVMKLLSLKGVAFGASFFLTMTGVLESWAFVLVTLVLIFGEKALEYIVKLKGG